MVALRQAKQSLPNVIDRNMKDDEWEDFDEENSDLNEKDIDKNDIKEISDLLNMPSKKIH